MADQKLCEIVALEKGKKAKTDASLTAAYQLLSKTDLFKGLSRTYTPATEENEQLPSETTLVQVNLNTLVKDTFAPFAEFLDVSAARDWSNQVATADVVVDGKVLISKAPIPYLLFLEKRLVDVRTFISKLPTLDPAEEWKYDSNRGCWVSSVTQTRSTKKVARAFVKAEATDKHPAQVDVVHEDVRVGTWDTVKYSSAFPVDTVKEMLSRVERLLDAVKSAREVANTTIAVKPKVGDSIVNYILA